MRYIYFSKRTEYQNITGHQAYETISVDKKIILHADVRITNIFSTHMLSKYAPNLGEQVFEYVDTEIEGMNKISVT